MHQDLGRIWERRERIEESSGLFGVRLGQCFCLGMVVVGATYCSEFLISSKIAGD